MKWSGYKTIAIFLIETSFNNFIFHGKLTTTLTNLFKSENNVLVIRSMKNVHAVQECFQNHFLT